MSLMKRDMAEPLTQHPFPFFLSFFFLTEINSLPSDQISDET